MLKWESFKLFKRNYHIFQTFLFQKRGEMSCEYKTLLSVLQLSLSLYIHISKPSSSLLGMFLFRSHIFHCSSPKGSQNITWKGVVISPLFLLGIWPRQASNLKDFASFSCMLSFLKRLEIKLIIPLDFVCMRKIFFCCWVWDGGREASESWEDAAF